MSVPRFSNGFTRSCNADVTSLTLAVRTKATGSVGVFTAGRDATAGATAGAAAIVSAGRS